MWGSIAVLGKSLWVFGLGNCDVLGLIPCCRMWNSILNELEGAVLVAGKFALRRRWSWKIASCLPMPAQDLFEQPLRTFANRMWCEAGNLHVHDVQDSLDCGKQLLAGSSTIAEAKNDFTFFNHTLLITILTPPSRDGYWYLRMNDSKVWLEVDRIFVEDCRRHRLEFQSFTMQLLCSCSYRGFF
jgi:hypothetical protein